MGENNNASITKLDTKKMSEAAASIKTQVTNFQKARQNVEVINTELLSTWAGKARDTYEIKYRVLKKNLEDIDDSLYDFYEAINKSIASYMETDEKAAKSIVEELEKAFVNEG